MPPPTGSLRQWTAPPALLDLLFVIAPHSLLLDIAGPAEAFRLANLHRERRGLPPRFRLRFCGTGRRQRRPRWDSGSPTSSRCPSAWTRRPGSCSSGSRARSSPGSRRRSPPPRGGCRGYSEALAAASTPHRLITICSGALLAARAGLLGTLRCTTHHELLPALRALAPRAQVVDNRVFLLDGPLASSAGITAGIDLALHLVAEECGEALAASVAEDMVVYLRRSPRDPELSPFLIHRRHLHAAVHRVQDAILAAPERDWDMAALAAVGFVTERHLLRLFLEHAGVSPLGYLQSIRLERARQSLERGASVTGAAEIRRLPLGSSTAPRLEPAVGRLAARFGAGGELSRRGRGGPIRIDRRRSSPHPPTEGAMRYGTS
jgi:transcriptional regulator GlxA family with amidase domain